jgi:rod shape determining protein RodA
MMRKRAVYHRMDKLLLFAALAITVLAMVFIYSATSDRLAQDDFNEMVMKQLIWVVIGLGVMFVIANMDYMRIIDLAYILYMLSLGGLLLLFFIGSERYGAKRWLSFGPVSLQPSEFVKLGVIIVLAAFMGDRREKIGSLANFIWACVLVCPAFLLILVQPDLGTALILMPILFGIMFVCGERRRYMLASIGLGIAGMPLFWHVLKEYQRNRLLVFINPNVDPLGAGYTIIQSKIAAGSGGFFGKGWLNGTQSQLKFLPEKHTDFIFSTIAEEWGFLGAIVLISLYLLIISRGIRIMEKTTDIYGKALAAGFTTLLAFQVLINISMTIGFMPVVGIPLPMISYGGSNTVMTLAGIGLLMSVAKRSHM